MSREAWIIDGVRSPRGGGKPGVGSMSHIHPQRILAQVLNALKDRVGFDPKDVEDVVMGTGSGRRRSRDGHRADVGARRRLAGDHARRFAAPLLRFGPAGGHGGGDGHSRGPPGMRDRRRRGIDVATGVALGRRLHREQRTPVRAVSAGAAGHLGGPDRHARRLHARRTSTRSACRARRARPRRSTTVASSAASCRSTTTTARWRSTATNIRARAPRWRASRDSIRRS